MANERPAGNASAGWAVVVGLLSIVAVPLAVAATRWSERYELLHAGFAIPIGLALGTGAVLLARRARTRHERTLGRAGRLRAAAWGRAFGIAGIAIAAAGLAAVTFALVSLRVANAATVSTTYLIVVLLVKPEGLFGRVAAEKV